MGTMKIRGGDLDLVEYEFTSFSPGENIRPCGLQKDYNLSPVSGIVVVDAPARIHLTVLDMNRFSPDRPGGGGIGFAIRTYCTPRSSARRRDSGSTTPGRSSGTS